MKRITIHVFLPREKFLVWAPIDAEHLYDDVYRILDCCGEDEAVEFGKGALAKCKIRRLSGDGGKIEDTLVAYELANLN